MIMLSQIIFIIYSIEIILSQNITQQYRSSTLNTCIGPCLMEQWSVIKGVYKCFLSEDCIGISFNVENGTICECSTIGVPEQATVPGNILYRATNELFCIRNVVDDAPDDYITATSVHYDDHNPYRARLNTKETDSRLGAWLPKTKLTSSEHIQVRFHAMKEVVGVATQGRHTHIPSQYVTSYMVSYSVDCVTFSFVKGPDSEPMVFQGNSNRNIIVWNVLPESILVVCVRIHPVSFLNHPSLRFGLKGCDI